jgi:hypothetical protein
VEIGRWSPIREHPGGRAVQSFPEHTITPYAEAYSPPNRATLTPTKVGAGHPSDVHHPDDVFLFSPILRGITYKIKKSLKFFAR